MDIGPLVGILVALIAILAGNVWEGGHLGSIVGGPAALIVVGGTIGATMVQYPLATVKGAALDIGSLFKKPKIEPSAIVDALVEYANQARREGILGLEKLAPNASDPFLTKALMMAVDGADSHSLSETMEIAISQEEEHGEEFGKVFETAGGYAPTIGIIGAVLGLIHVMSNLSDIAAVGSGIAGAFVATIYGVAVANIIFLPLGGRLKAKYKHQAHIKTMMLVGVLGIQEGLNPKLVRDRLSEYVGSHGDKKAAGGAGAAARAPALGLASLW